MKKTFLLLTTFIFASLITSKSHANGYVSIKMGLSDIRETEIKDHHDASFAPSGAIGVANGPFRAEIEYTHLTEADIEKEIYSNRDKDILNTKFNRIMGNAYIDLYMSRYIQPYIMAGAGVANYRINYQNNSYTGSNFSWNVGGGVGFKLNRNLALDIGCKYVDLGSVELDNQENTKMSFDTVETYTGLRFMF